MFTLKRTLICCLAFLLFAVIDQGAHAARLGINAGFYNEAINTPCARSREFGLRLGLYADRSVNDILYASAVRGNNLCGPSGCGYAAAVSPGPCTACEQAAYAPVPVAQSCGCNNASARTVSVPGYMVPPGCGCSSTVMTSAAPVGCGSNFIASPAVIQQAPAPKTEIYLLVLPEHRTQSEQPIAQAPQMPAQQIQMPPQAPPVYYKEPVEYQQPIRGYW